MSVLDPHTSGGIIRSASRAEDELNAVVNTRLRAFLPILVCVYVATAAAAVFLSPAGSAWPAGYVAYFSGLVCFSSWVLMRRKLIPVRRFPLVALGMAAFVLLYAFTSLRFVENPSTVAVIAVLFFVSGATAPSLVWHFVLVAMAAAGWLGIAWSALSLQDFYYWTLVLVSAAVLSAANVYFRRRNAGEHAPPAPAGDRFHREYLERAVEGTQDGLWYWELKGDVFHFSAAWAALLGFEKSELKTHPDEWLNRVHPGYLARLREELTSHLHGDAPQFRNEHRMRRKDGTYMWVLARATVIRDADGEPAVLAGSHSDITPLIEVEKRLLTDTFKDPLTGLANRSFLLSHLQMAVEEKSMRGKGAPLFAVVFLDLDRFKQINDTLGHHVGDELLRAVGGRLRNCARPDDVVARFGGDEFVVLLRALRDSEEAVLVAERMLKALLTPFQLGEHEILSGGSIGIALSKESFRSSDELLHFGDIAMYHSKKAGKGRVTLFRREMLEESDKQDQLKSELELAVERGQLLLHYQPSIHVATGRIVGAEALVRWRRENGEILYPDTFLPLAEKSDLIQKIGEWVLRTACAQNSEWQRAGFSPVRMSVNLSARQVQQRDLPQLVQRILEETRLGPEWLELEMTEASLMRNADSATALLRSLGDSGIRTAIDNFGIGSASLSNLRQLKCHTLKMDRGFVSEITTDPRVAALARGLITMAHHLGLSVVAEGVEQKDQFQFLSAEQCDNVQGYLIGRPVPGEELALLLRSATPVHLATVPTPTEPDANELRAMQAAVGRSAALQWAATRNARDSR